ncbi:MAG: extracellular solute-binding protein [Clostridia bacterium]|nr:extracellular solute-binding protein [Clostridia bacterium]
MKKQLSRLLAFTLLLSTIALFSCNFKTTKEPDIYDGAYDGSKVTINVWHTMFASSGISAIERAAERFKELYPNITVKTNVWDDCDHIYENIDGNPYAETPPNLVFCSPKQIVQYVNDNKVIELNRFIDSQCVIESTGETMGFTKNQHNDFVPAFLNGEKLGADGKIYSLPFSKETDLLYYNKTVFNELGLAPPKTWDEVENCIKILKDHYPDSTPLGYDSEENLFITLAAQYGSDYTNLNGEFLFDNDTNKEFVSKFADWYKNGWLTTSYIGYDTIESFANQEMFMSIASSRGAAYHSPNRIDGEYEFEVGVAPIPQVDLSNPKANTTGISFCILNNENTQEIYASWLFLKFLTTDPEAQAFSAIYNKSIPMINSAKESPTYKNFISKDISLQYSPVKVLFEQSCDYFVCPIFEGCEKATENIDLLVQSVFSKYQLGADNSAMIDEEFNKALKNCTN